MNIMNSIGKSYYNYYSYLSNQANSGLFSSSSNNNQDMFGAMYDNLSTFSSIKSGLYTKLAKKNYSNHTQSVDNTTSTQNKVVNTENKTEKAATKAKYLEVQDDASDLASSVGTVKSKISKVKSLNDDSKVTSEEALNKAKADLVTSTEKFVENYNSLMDSTSKVDTKSITSNQGMMTKLTGLSYNKNALNDIGIEISDDNKLKINKEKMQKADIESFDKVFSNSGYGDTLMAKATQISSYAEMQATDFSSGTSYSVSGNVNSLYMLGSLLNGYV